MKGHTFMILGSGNRMKFYLGRKTWFGNSEPGFTTGQVKMAEFLFNEVPLVTNFLLTSRIKRSKVESRLKSLIENNEW